MFDLLASDLRRMLWRPAARALGVIVVVAIAIAGVTAYLQTGTAKPFDLVTGLPAAIRDASAPLALLGFIVGASLVGADYASHAFATLLTWEPRRRRVMGVHAAASALVVWCASLAALAVLCLALLPTALVHGTGGSPSGGWYVSLAGLAIRCALLAAAIAVVGVACATITRSTVAAVAAIALYWLAVERTVWGLWPSVARWLFVADAQAWMAPRHDSNIALSSGGETGHAVGTAGLLLLGVVLALYVIASWAISRRDVT
jgi:ABC-2 type transport system permease protein